jgi:hypothetical protein
MRSKRYFVLILLACVLCQPAWAQYPSYYGFSGGGGVGRTGAAGRGGIRRYTRPAGPTLPNELNYFRYQNGVLDNYNSYVAPRQQLTNQLQSMNYQRELENQQTQKQINQLRETTAAPTGTGAGFMNYSHYYPSANRRR